MRLHARHALAAALLLLAATAASAAEVTVNFIKPDSYNDLPRMARDRELILKDLREHFVKLGQNLPAGQSLKIDVSDIDLAGRLEPGRRIDDIRILNGGADWPHMALHYSLEADGTVVRSGDSQLSNMNYIQRLNRYSEGDSLRYEKQMLDDWFQATFTESKLSKK
ncbi:DUF3016 domain-containing protein [Massilia sp. BJB1822]|uniref:DUF3016 domain-containing protein n=1 Tax=Massilia sp. BJB1822 TaxID=2744470 RepID=UPI0015943064|nr:DUF3016 domain-containing protein [Massilia sp. BJB1822]NVE01579.1 DUF3016 domain-containing protein [Massilia sp. BJB1822]